MLKKYWNIFSSWSWIKNSVIILSTLLLLGILFVISLFLGVRWQIITDLPEQDELQSIINPISSEIYSREGKLFGSFFDENRGDLRPEDLTEDFKNALIATEDVRFKKHKGVDTRSLGRVIIKSLLLQNDSSGGGSTLTQQLAKNLYPRKRFWALSLPINKFREMCIARDLEKVYSKDEILLLYSNTVSFGERAFGLYTASRRFFNKRPNKLSIAESATLVGLLKAPTYYSPRNNPDRCLKRRNVVIQQMVKYEFLESETADEIKEEPLDLKYQSLTETIGLGRYFQQFVKKEFYKWSAVNKKPDGEDYDIDRDGLRIYTTLDFDMQIAAEQILSSHMSSLQKTFNNSWKGGKIFGSKDIYLKNALHKDPYYKVLKSKGFTEDQIIEEFEKSKEVELWSWEGRESQEMSKMDSLKHYLSLLHAGLLASDPETGEILVYLGGNDYGEFQYDNVRAKRQVGSTFKPIVYLTAMEQGVYACDYFPNEKRTYTSYDDWTPENSDGDYGGYMSVKNALTNSVNTVSVQMIFKAGIDNVINKAQSLGINSDLPEVPSIVLGTADISLYEMVQAYSTIANNGEKKDFFAIRKIEDLNGNVLFEKKISKGKKETSLEYGMLHAILSNVVNEGTGARLYNYNIPFQVMGKTGTTQNQTDGWFIGYTNNLVIGSWVGAQNRNIHFRNLGTGSGGRTALPMVGGLFEYAASQNYRPAPMTMDLLPNCPDSISQEEYAMLQEYPRDYDRIYAQRDGTNLLDVIFGRSETSSNDESVSKRRRRNPRQEKKRKSDFEKLKRKVEKNLKRIFGNKKRGN